MATVLLTVMGREISVDRGGGHPVSGDVGADRVSFAWVRSDLEALTRRVTFYQSGDSGVTVDYVDELVIPQEAIAAYEDALLAAESADEAEPAEGESGESEPAESEETAVGE